MDNDIIELENNLLELFDLDALELSENEEHIKIHWLVLNKESQGLGLGRKVIDLINNYADSVRKEVLIELPGSTSVEVLDNEVLKNWYESLGFESINDKEMVRENFNNSLLP